MQPWPGSRGRRFSSDARLPFYRGLQDPRFHSGIYHREEQALANKLQRYGPEGSWLYESAYGGERGAMADQLWYDNALNQFMGMQMPGAGGYPGGWF